MPREHLFTEKQFNPTTRSRIFWYIVGNFSFMMKHLSVKTNGEGWHEKVFVEGERKSIKMFSPIFNAYV